MRILVACLAAGALLAGCGEDEAVTVNGDGYSFEAPEGWKEGDGEALGQAVGGDVYDTVLLGDTVEKQFAENFNVIIQDPVPGGLGVRQWAQQNATMLSNPDFGARIFPGSEGFEPVTDAPRRTELGGEEAYELDYLVNSENGELFFRAVLAVHEGAGYIGTFASGESAEEAEDSYSVIVDSWEFE